MKQLNSKKTRFPLSDKILVIQPIAEVYGEGNERQLCQEIEVHWSVEPEIVRVVSLGATEIIEITRFKINDLQSPDILITLFQTTKLKTCPN